MTECDLYNASYSVDFSFRYPDQDHDLRIVDWLNTVDYDSSGAEGVDSYLAVMDAFGKILVGTSSYKAQYQQRNDYLTAMSMMDVEWQSGDAVRTGLEQLFQNITLSLFSDSRAM